MLSVVISLVKWGGLDEVLTQGDTLPEPLICPRSRIGDLIIKGVVVDNFICPAAAVHELYSG
jgi:hypothetical protein